MRIQLKKCSNNYYYIYVTADVYLFIIYLLMIGSGFVMDVERRRLETREKNYLKLFETLDRNGKLPVT